MLPSWGAHQRSMPHHSCGITSVRFRLLAIAMAVCTCYTPKLSCLPQKKAQKKKRRDEDKEEEEEEQKNCIRGLMIAFEYLLVL